jgi:ABC-type polysaccharide/polyol phosphate export permease
MYPTARKGGFGDLYCYWFSMQYIHHRFTLHDFAHDSRLNATLTFFISGIIYSYHAFPNSQNAMQMINLPLDFIASSLPNIS